MVVVVRVAPSEMRIVKARRLRLEMTTPERKLWKHLRQIRTSGSHFRRQAPIGPYYADFACHEARIVIEIDGETHAAPPAATRDEVRSRYLESHGYQTLRFWNGDVMKNIEGVMESIQQAVAAKTEPPPLTPPHASRGRGRP
jgi:very-short-patch-repair endonuclease